MKSFLEHVAADLLSRYGTNLSRVAVVFPNKRASLFLNEHLARLAGQPLWSPAYITISDLFRSHSDLKVADPILLVCELHKCFTACTGIDETLDHFYGWGQLLLSDFDDLDKNMGPADKVFANLRDIHELDDVSYLTDEQREMIRRFFSNFSEDHNSELKQRFLRLWSHIGDIYQSFNKRLASQQLAYEGALYRQVATDESIQFEYDTYAFVGFNLLQQVEQTLFRRLEQEGKAIFYQDTEEIPPQTVNYISAPTENIQARYVSQWLTPERIAAGRRTAIVLCDEKLLQAVIHSLPEEVEKINVTTGYPLNQTAIASFVAEYINLQVNGWSAKTETFRRHWLDVLRRHPYAKLLPEDFTPAHHTDNVSLLHALLDLIRTIATAASQPDGEADSSRYTLNSSLTVESLFRMYTLLNRVTDLVDSGNLLVDIITLQRLIAQLVQSTTIPFHGEPAEGVQVMGVLETRNLDFDHVLLLSCNEGNMPRGVNDTSFIPYALRKAYGLTTVDHKVAIYQHYFHRLLQRAEDVTILYNNATADGHTGEMSRFMLQLMVESGQEVRFQTLKALIEPDDTEDDLIDNRIFGNIFHKSAEVIYKRLMQLSGSQITAFAIDDMLKREVEIEQTVDRAIKSELFHIKDPASPMPPLDGLQLINREVIIRYVRQLLEIDRRLAPFTILGLEKPVAMRCTIPGVEPVDTTIAGIIDRLDSITDPETGEERIRVVDYKTGSRRQKDLPDVEAIFDPTRIKDHSDYYLQAFIYSHIVRQKTSQPVSPALLFIQHAGADDYDPTLKFGREPIRDIAPHADTFLQLLDKKIGEIFDPAIPFSPTDDRDHCSHCPYASLCGH